LLPLYWVLELTPIVLGIPYGPWIWNEFDELDVATTLPVKSVISPSSSAAETAAMLMTGLIVPVI